MMKIHEDITHKEKNYRSFTVNVRRMMESGNIRTKKKKKLIIFERMARKAVYFSTQENMKS